MSVLLFEVAGNSAKTISNALALYHTKVNGHFLGLPDLNDGSNGGLGVGSYCLMGVAWGFDGSDPHLLSPWYKIQLGWATPTLINGPGTYSIEQSCDVPQIYKITRAYPNREYLLIENKQKCVLVEDVLPQPGLAVWHINDSASFVTQGHPGQTGWPANDQSDGNYNLERDRNRGDGSDIWHP